MSGVQLSLTNDNLETVKIGNQNGECKTIDDPKVYHLALTDFNAGTGEDYLDVSDKKVAKEPVYVDSEAVKDFIINEGPLDPANFAVSRYFTRN